MRQSESQRAGAKKFLLYNFDVTAFCSAAKSVLKQVATIRDVADPQVINGIPSEKVLGLTVRLGLTLDRAFLAAFPDLRVIASVTTGLDHIDLDYCRANHIEVISLKGEVQFLRSINATPEHTWGLTMALVRKLPWAFDSVRNGEWKRADFFGNELSGKTLGIIGYGRIGKIISRYARAFGMKVLATDVRKDPRCPKFVRPSSLTSLLKASDIVSVHVPLSAATRHFIAAQHFALMKSTAVLINTARGAVVDESALLSALKSGTIAGAAVDVLEAEVGHKPISSAHPLIKYAKHHRNLLITPHIAGSSYESLERTGIFVAHKLKRYLQSLAS